MKLISVQFSGRPPRRPRAASTGAYVVLTGSCLRYLRAENKAPLTVKAYRLGVEQLRDFLPARALAGRADRRMSIKRLYQAIRPGEVSDIGSQIAALFGLSPASGQPARLAGARRRGLGSNSPWDHA